MSSSSSFYVTLPSNSSMDFFPDNTLSTYVTKLPQPFDLKGEWEVGLSEIQFPITWYNVKEKEARMYYLSTPKGEQIVEMTDISPPHGHYSSANILIDQINEAMGTKKEIEFTYNEISQKITIKFVDESTDTFLAIAKPLAELMGFDLEDLQKLSPDVVMSKAEDLIAIHSSGDKKSYTGSRVCDLQRGFYAIYVYCDLVEPTVVGDVKVPLLRTVNISGREGEIVNRTFETVQYMPLHRKQFETIDINIRDDTGRPVPFQRGKVIATLHFRMKRPAYF
jgi:hypothetical protein